MNDTLKIIAEFVDNASAGLKKAGIAVKEFTQGVGEGARAEIEAQRATASRTTAVAGSVAPTAAATGAVAALAAGLVVAALATKGFFDAIEEADKLDDLSDKTGIAASKLREYGYVAKLSGSSLDGIGTALNKLSKATDMSDEAATKQAQTFKQLGVSATDVNGKMKSSEVLFGELREAFSGIEEGPEKSAAAFRLFGSEAKNLMPLLNMSTKEFNDMKKELADLSLIGPEAFDAFAKSSGEFNDNIDKASTVSNSFFTALANELVPVLNVLMKEMLSSAKEGGLLRSVMTGLVETFKFLIPYVKAGAEIFSGFTSTVKIAGKSIGAVMAAIAAVASGGGIAAVKQVWSDYKDDVSQVADEHVKFVTKLNAVGKAADGATPKIDESKRSISSLAKVAKDAKSSLEEMVKSLNASVNSNGDEAIKQTIEANQKYRDDIKKGLSPAYEAQLLREALALIKKGEALRTAAKEQEAYDAARQTLADQTDNATILEYEATLVGKNADERERLLDKFKEEIALRKVVAGLGDTDAARIAEETRLLNERIAAGKTAANDARVANDIFDNSLTQLQQSFSSRIQIALKMYEDGKITVADFTKYQQEQYDALLNKTKDTTDKSKTFWEEAAKGMQDAMQTFFYDFMQGNMTNLVDDFQKMISKMVAQALAANLGEKLFGAGFEKGNGVGGYVGSFLSMFGGARVAGGPVSAGKAYLVGEKRPEIFVPNTSGTILPSADGITGGGVTVQMHVNTIDAKSFMSHMAPLERDVATMVHNATRKYNLGM